MADRLDLVGDLFVTLAAIAKHRGISPATLPDCWTFEAGPWQVALNATSTAHVAHGIKVPPGHVVAIAGPWLVYATPDEASGAGGTVAQFVDALKAVPRG